MKTRLASLLFLAAALSTPAFASGKLESPVAVRVSQAGSHVERGTPRVAVYAHLGTPSRQLSPEVWAYDGYKADTDAVNDRGCDTLIISFVNHRVADLKLANRAAVQSIAAELKLNRARAIAAAR
ncbi:MAG: hypothetical protein A3G75_03940 [Verrucomicrobia bacterium RIFCSPLOWO2_12_FULL_64_8]|nr:MAG: hypothetical protein A3G75_03940 [Verrucomicrobia bacterium RIFCSPLOWO2_12_FULL_64_8]